MKLPPISDAYASSVTPGSKPEGKVSGATPVGQGRAVPSARSAEPVRTGSGVTVQLSGSVQSISAAGLASEVYNVEKVQAVRQDIERGVYRVNAEAIADRMLTEAGQSLGARRSG